MHGPPLGISDTQYGTSRLTLDSGDSLLLYTDGVTEAMNADLAEFGTDRLEFIIESSLSQLDIRNLVAKVVSTVKEFAGCAEQSDDITVMALHYNGDQSGM